MLFNSYIFIFAFLPVVLAVYLLLEKRALWRAAFAWLTLASLFFYAWWKLEYLLLLLTSIGVNVWLGRILLDGKTPARYRKPVLVLGICFNLGLLAFFKYAGFFVANVDLLTGAKLSIPEIVLPIGISFITFQKIAFLVDAYRGQVRHFSFLNFSLFVTFFPQLIAGPIVHHSEVMPQFATPRDARRRYEDFAVGLGIFCIGLFKKVIIADTCAIYADRGYALLHAGQTPDMTTAWIAVLSYSFQLYYDFSGYSDMAVGLARMFGIRLPANFYSPYKTTSIIAFWQCWHMTLSRFLRDYLYIPLGGNRRGPVRRYLNLMIVMLLGGLWHGANWTFVIWGAAHGAFLAVNHGWRSLSISRWPIFRTPPAMAAFVLLTFLVVTLAWVPFRANTFGDAGRMLYALLPLHLPWSNRWELVHQIAAARHVFRTEAGMVLTAVALVTFLLPNTYQIFACFRPAINLDDQPPTGRRALRRLDWRAATAFASIFVVAVLALSRVSPFLYFQF